MQQIPAIQSLRSDTGLKVDFSKSAHQKSETVLDNLLKQIQSKPRSERQWEIERWQHELKHASSEQKNQWHQSILQEIDTLESKGVKQGNHRDEQTERYGLLMDLYHASRYLRDYSVPDSTQATVPAQGQSLSSISLIPQTEGH